MSTKSALEKLKGIDLFSGCGGLTEGLKNAGFEVVGAVEVDEFAATTYSLNHSEVHLWNSDIRSLAVSQVLTKLNMRKGELDLLGGCPPCQGFSTLRTRNGSMCRRDSRNTLLKEFLRFVEGLLPRAIMLENVPGLQSYWQFQPFCRKIRELGYIGECKVVDASDYSVPQRRKRLIFLAGLGRSIAFPTPNLTKLTVRASIGFLEAPGCTGDPIHDLPENRTASVMSRIKLVPKNGGSRSQLPRHAQLACHQKSDGYKDVYGRIAWDKLAPTITCGCFNPSKGRFLHPDQDRAISMREASILQGFPRDYRFSAKRGKVALALMIGNALPPPLIKAHAQSVSAALSSRIPDHA